MHKLYKILLLTCAILIITLGGYVYYITTYEPAIIKVTGFVNDIAKKIDLDYSNSINNVCAALSQKTKVDVVILILENTRPYDSKEYAGMILKKYEDNNAEIAGAVIFLVNLQKGSINLDISQRIQSIFSMNDGEKILNDSVIPLFNEANKLAGELISKKEPPAKANEYIGRGILEGVRAIDQKISEEHAKQKFADEMVRLRKREAENSKSRWTFSIWFYLGVVFLLIVITLIIKVQMRLRCPKCYYRLKITEETIEVPEHDKPGLTIEVVQCNHCGYYDMKRIVTYARSFYLSHFFGAIWDVMKNYYRRKKREHRKNNLE